MDCLLAFHAVGHLGVWKPSVARSKAIEEVEGGWNTNGTAFDFISRPSP
jgi:hypothetical protein